MHALNNITEAGAARDQNAKTMMSIESGPLAADAEAVTRSRKNSSTPASSRVKRLCLTHFIKQADPEQHHACGPECMTDDAVSPIVMLHASV
jgi:hypothetical protein